MKIKKRIKRVIPPFLLSFYHLGWAFLSALFYRFPGRKIKVIGVTGTNGKTTTVRMTDAVLREAGFKTAVLSSIRFKIGDKEEENEMRMTMPGRGVVQRFLREAVEADCEYAVIEVTSEGVAQHRHRFIPFQAGVFTNLAPEHIESHGSFEEYRKAKGRFFKKVKKTHILNRDDEEFDYFNRFPAQEKYYFGVEDEFKGIVRAEKVRVEGRGIRFKVEGRDFELALLGEFNVYNALAAVCVGLAEGVELEVAAQALKKVEGVPGRMEMVIDEPFTVMVDYAFTPNALKQVYKTITANYKPQNTKLICVLGACGGGRDKWKRPVLGKLASRFCDRVIVTNEDPYDEDPMEIIEDVAGGAGQKAERIKSRRQAVKRALEEAEEGDALIITGKGCEPSIVVEGGKRIPWDDRRVVRQEYRKIYG